MFTFLAWIILFYTLLALAILALVLYPLFWLISLPFRLVGIAVDGVFSLLKGLLCCRAGCFSDGEPEHERSRCIEICFKDQHDFL